MEEEELRKGPWFVEEDEQLTAIVEIMGEKRWDSLAKASGTLEMWSKIARRLPGRTDNEIKNYWRSHLRKKAQVQAQGYCENFTKNAKQEVYNPPCDTVSITSDGSLKASDDPLHALELSNYAIANSPYESRLTDWASGWLEEQSEVRHHGDCPSLDLCFCYPVWNLEDFNHTSIWSSSGPLWT
ncbi:hypothetical protein RHGRI_007171 [Rhododendron griersonianum]|uniref:MYB transcription factor n=1 Tax=Rhododendron griersonianum TaxID=479676 RepID=A0AAV6KVW6_9ERIC|nr:hypothetical protein RHGRI_007171 [Rhododendron griersonianum]